MEVGDLVQHFLTEQLGIILEVKMCVSKGAAAYHVVWTTQGESLFGAGTKEWCGWNSIDLAREVVNESR